MHIKRRDCKKLILTVILLGLLTGICACTTNSSEEPLEESDSDIGTVTPGTEYYEDFLVDNILSFSDGTEELHYHIYIPEDYDGTKAYALYISLPGYGGYYFQGAGVNLQMEDFASEAKNYVSDMIIAAPQPDDWGMTSANQTIGLTKYLLSTYNVDRNRVYLSGYSGGGETLSLVLGTEPQLYTAALHVSSQWDGEYEPLIRSRTPLYLVIGEGDEYYGSGPAEKTYESFRDLYEKEGFSADEINELLILDVKEQSYFTERSVSNQHGGGGLFAYDEDIMNWLFSETSESRGAETTVFTAESIVGEVIADPAFKDFGHLLFPVDRAVSEEMTLADVSSSSVYVWYSNIQSDKTVEIINHLKGRAAAGQPIFYSVYSEEEIAADSSKADTGLFYFGGENGKPYAVMNAGGGFSYVGAMHDSFPHALEAGKHGYNSFALIYRPDDPYADLAKAIVYIHDHAEEFGVDAEHYSLWGGSAGARMAAVLGNEDYLYQLTRRSDIPQADAVIMQYTGYSDYAQADAPTYVCVGTNDGIASWRMMQSRLEMLDSLGIPTEFHSYDSLSHGFGLGTGTIAEGWVDDAITFWETQM